MRSKKPNRVLKLCCPPLLHASVSGVRLYDEPGIKLFTLVEQGHRSCFLLLGPFFRFVCFIEKVIRPFDCFELEYSII